MKRQIGYMIGLTVLAAVAVQGSQQQLASSMAETRVETARTHEQLNSTLGTLNALTTQTKGDLRPAYNNFCAEVTKTQAASARTSTRVKWMDTDGQQYFKTWQDTVNSIANASLRKKAQKRMDTVKASYNKARTALTEAGEKFKPFLSNLTDIQKALSTDVTAGGVKAIRSTVKSANWNQQFVDKSINTALKELGQVEKGLSTSSEGK